jgi:hypothetical protein
MFCKPISIQDHSISLAILVMQISNHQLLLVEQAIDVYDIQFLVRSYQKKTTKQSVSKLRDCVYQHQPN